MNAKNDEMAGVLRDYLAGHRVSYADVAGRAVSEQSLCAGDASGNADAARSAFERFQASGDRSALATAIERLEWTCEQLKEAGLRATEALCAAKRL